MAKHRTRVRQQQLRARHRARALDAPKFLWFDAADVQLTAAAAPAAASPPVALEAAAPDGQAPRLRRFEMVAYNGGRMHPAGFSLPVVVDLTGCQVAPGARPSFLEHDRNNIVGHHDTITVHTAGRGSIVCSGVVSGAGPAAQEVLASADNGFPWRASIGGPIHKLVFTEEGEQVEANGQKFTGPLLVVREMTIHECSFVALAGDDTATARILATRSSTPPLATTMNFADWLAAKGFTESDLTASQQAALRAMFDAEADESDQEPPPASIAASAPAPIPPAPSSVAASGAASRPAPAAAAAATSPDPVAALRASAADELERQSQITALCASYDVTEATIGQQRVNLAAHAIRENWTRERTELEAMRAARPQQGPAIHSGGQQVTAQALEAALCLSAGLSEQIAARDVSAQAMEQATSRDLRAAGIHALMHYVLRAAGRSVRLGRIDDEMIRATYEADRMLTAASGPSTISLSGILGNVANKALLAAYQNVPNNVHEIAAKTSNRDFKPHTRYRLTASGIFLEVGADGELKDLDLGEETYSNQLKTFGRTVSLSRQMQINDDLGAFLQLPALLGRGYALALLKAVFKLINSNPNNFFHASNKNYQEGADTVLGVLGLSTAIKLFRDQVDAGGEPIAIEPKVLLVGTGDEVTAWSLYNDMLVNETTTANKPKTSGNPHKGKFKPVVSPYISNTALGGTAVNWYLFADPLDVPAVEVAYLDGNETPTVQFAELDFRHLGIIFRAFGDFGVALGNPKGAVKSKGSV